MSVLRNVASAGALVTRDVASVVLSALSSVASSFILAGGSLASPPTPTPSPPPPSPPPPAPGQRGPNTTLTGVLSVVERLVASQLGTLQVPGEAPALTLGPAISALARLDSADAASRLAAQITLPGAPSSFSPLSLRDLARIAAQAFPGFSPAGPRPPPPAAAPPPVAFPPPLAPPPSSPSAGAATPSSFVSGLPPVGLQTVFVTFSFNPYAPSSQAASAANGSVVTRLQITAVPQLNGSAAPAAPGAAQAAAPPPPPPAGGSGGSAAYASPTQLLEPLLFTTPSGPAASGGARAACQFWDPVLGAFRRAFGSSHRTFCCTRHRLRRKSKDKL